MAEHLDLSLSSYGIYAYLEFLYVYDFFRTTHPGIFRASPALVSFKS